MLIRLGWCPRGAHPYGKDGFPQSVLGGYRPWVQYRIMRQPRPVQFSAWTTWEAPDPAFWVLRGYAVVNADLRREQVLFGRVGSGRAWRNRRL